MKLQDEDLTKYEELRISFGYAVRELHGLNEEELKALMAKMTKDDFFRFEALANKDDSQGIADLLNEINARPI